MAWLTALDPLAVVWQESMLRAAAQGGTLILLVWFVSRVFPRIPARAQSWLYRLAYLKLVLALVPVISIALPLLPAPAAPDSLPALPTPSTRSSAFVDRITVPASVTDAGPAHALEPGRAAAANSNGAVSLSPVALVRIGLLFAWLIGLVCCGVRLARSVFHTRRLRHCAVAIADPALREILQKLGSRLGIAPPVLLLETDGIRAPSMTGALTPAILLPTPVLKSCSAAEVRMILAHELAHLKRGDLWWWWVSGVVHALFFFHPLVWLLEREAMHAQEAACDEMALSTSGVAAIDYGELLLKVVTLSRSCPSPAFAGASTIQSLRSLKRRIVAMKYLPVYYRKPWAPTAMTLVALGIAGILPWRVVAMRAAAAPHSRSTPAVVSPAHHLRTSHRRGRVLFTHRAHHLRLAVMRSLKLAAPVSIPTQRPAAVHLLVTKRAIVRQAAHSKKVQTIAAEQRRLQVERLGVMQDELVRARAQYKAGTVDSKRVEEAQYELAMAKADLSRNPNRERALAALTLARQELVRAEAQYQAGASTQADLTSARLKLLDAEAVLAPARANLEARLKLSKERLALVQAEYAAGLLSAGEMQDARTQVALSAANLSPDPKLARARAQLESANSALALTEARYKAGATTSDDLQLARLRAETAALDLKEAQPNH